MKLRQWLPCIFARERIVDSSEKSDRVEDLLGIWTRYGKRTRDPILEVVWKLFVIKYERRFSS